MHYSLFNEYTNRNVMTLDAWDWTHRTGDGGVDNSADADYVACSTYLGRAFGDPRPHTYEGTLAHEYQHLLEYYESPGDANGRGAGARRQRDCPARLLERDAGLGSDAAARCRQHVERGGSDTSGITTPTFASFVTANDPTLGVSQCADYTLGASGP